MPKVSDTVRITPRRVSKEEILDYISKNPGQHAGQIAAALGQRHSELSVRLLNFHKRGRLKRKHQDGLIRYYPANYKLSGFEKFIPPGVTQAWKCLECGKEFDTQNKLKGHKLGAHTAHPNAHKRKTPAAAPPPADSVEQLIKQYYWEVTDREHTLQDFIRWYRGLPHVR